MNDVREFEHHRLATGATGHLSFHRRDGTGQPVVAIPGLGMPARTWFGVLDFVDRLAAIVEPRGSGASSDLSSPPDGRDVADDVVAVMDAIGWQCAHLAGVSMGGMIAQHVAIHHPRRALSLGLFNTYAHPGPWGDLAWRLRRHLTETGDPVAQRLAATLLLTSPDAVESTPELVDLLADVWDSTQPRPDSYRNQMTFCAGHDTRRALRALSIPSLVVSSEHDLLCTPAAGRQLAELLDARFELAVHATHLYSNDDPAGLAAIWNDFLFRHDTDVRQTAGESERHDDTAPIHGWT